MKKIYLLILVLNLSCGAGVSDYIEKLPGGFEFVSESNEQQLIYGNGILMPCTVLDYTFDKEFILVYQKPLIDCIDKPEIQIVNVDTTQFWIIDINNNVLLGPYNAHNFKKKRQDLNISPFLSFDNVE